MKAAGAPSELPIKDAGFLLVPAGKGRFHALASGRSRFRMGEPNDPVYYLEYAKNAWSAPVQIGQYWSTFMQRTLDPPVDPENDFEIVSDNDGQALLLWPTENELVARWITLK